MSLTLGQKLRQAREALGIPISEVAAQTRIAPLYIESIDNDDYRALPGGIFNRGFVKSYAKYVGVDEQEALADYATLLNDTEGNDVEEVKTYKPQVLTDDNTTSSIVPTLIIAIVILGLMTGGILLLVRQFSKPAFPEEIKKTHSDDPNSGVEVATPVETVSPTVTERSVSSQLPTASPISNLEGANSNAAVHSPTFTAPTSITNTKPTHTPEKPKTTANANTAVSPRAANTSVKPMNKATR